MVWLYEICYAVTFVFGHSEEFGYVISLSLFSHWNLKACIWECLILEQGSPGLDSPSLTQGPFANLINFGKIEHTPVHACHWARRTFHFTIWLIIPATQMPIGGGRSPASRRVSKFKPRRQAIRHNWQAAAHIFVFDVPSPSAYRPKNSKSNFHYWISQPTNCASTRDFLEFIFAF